MGFVTKATPPIFQKFDLGQIIYLLLLIAINLILILALQNNSKTSFENEEETLPTLVSGQQLTQELVSAAYGSEQVAVASGAYIPETGMVLYTKWTEGGEITVRVWAVRLLSIYAPQFEALDSNASLIWVIDYGHSPVNQEVISVPLNRIDEPSAFRYHSLPGIELADSELNSSFETAESNNANVTNESVIAETGDVENEAELAGEEQTLEETSDAFEQNDPNNSIADQDTTESNQTNEPIVNGNVNSGISQTSENFIDTFDSDQAEEWLTFSGEWRIEDGVYFQSQLGAFDLGTSSPFRGNNYTLIADIRYIDGEMGAGYIFNMTHRNKKAGSQMLNFIEQGNAVQWGSFNESGDFVFGGTADTKNVADGEWHTLELTVANGLADLLIDSEIVFQGIELAFVSGYAGLLVSNSTVEFDNVAFTQNERPTSVTLGEAVQIETNYTFDDETVAGWLPVAGNWTWSNGEYEQRQTNEFDRFSSFNIQMVAPYSYTAEMRFIEGEMGAGLIFNMQDRGSKNQSHMVSFTANGTFLQWGTFDRVGVFNFLGGVPVPDTQDGDWHQLSVAVDEQTFDILLDGDIIAMDIPLTYTSGFVGLFDGLSWVAYDNVQLSGLGRSLIIDDEEALDERDTREDNPASSETPAEEDSLPFAEDSTEEFVDETTQEGRDTSEENAEDSLDGANGEASSDKEVVDESIPINEVDLEGDDS
ncbi:MAG: hypothetical protein AAF490_01320 [Chloroflexota bacterium]